MWAMPRDASVLSLSDQVVLNNLEVLCRQNVLMLKLLTRIEQQLTKSENISKGKKRKDESDNEGDDEDEAAVRCIKEQFWAVVTTKYDSFIARKKYKPYVKRGSTATFGHNATEFRDAICDELESDSSESNDDLVTALVSLSQEGIEDLYLALGADRVKRAAATQVEPSDSDESLQRPSRQKRRKTGSSNSNNSKE
ncbi:uncharacterized protein CCOS01_13719 [Colletotrichum costaricense]|uniref:Uncharacterized protein n=1 Tax=Colletotrichum costaricense TaxID=1209916 RepID=A0AAI9YKT5_9PEZI|nr:uncharacterized protein CCOS01_13719 [Colletotrichum costaricense]KAK1514438.1 hypothetical protein CCOS01_13719 [Colletotrichum costaricense]